MKPTASLPLLPNLLKELSVSHSSQPTEFELCNILAPSQSQKELVLVFRTRTLPTFFCACCSVSL